MPVTTILRFPNFHSGRNGPHVTLGKVNSRTPVGSEIGQHPIVLLGHRDTLYHAKSDSLHPSMKQHFILAVHHRLTEAKQVLTACSPTRLVPHASY